MIKVCKKYAEIMFYSQNNLPQLFHCGRLLSQTCFFWKYSFGNLGFEIFGYLYYTQTNWNINMWWWHCKLAPNSPLFPNVSDLGPSCFFTLAPFLSYSTPYWVNMGCAKQLKQSLCKIHWHRESTTSLSIQVDPFFRRLGYLRIGR